MTYFVDSVLAQKKKEIGSRKKYLSEDDLLRMIKEFPPTFRLLSSLVNGSHLIAEIKNASPSHGIFFRGTRVEELAEIYQRNGATAVSVVTEELFFLGCLDDLQRVRTKLFIPILRKDFIVDPYQILESRYNGADAVLLITSLLSPQQLKTLIGLTHELGMDALVETHTESEIEAALDAGAKIIGINNRDLSSLKIDLTTALTLLPKIPDSIIKVVESGIKKEEDLLIYKDLNVNAFLIGEALMTCSSPGLLVKRFRQVMRGT